MKELLLKVINGEEKSMEVPFQNLDSYDEILQELGLVYDFFEQNGASIDFWVHYDKDGKRYCLSGSLWYSDNLRFSRND